MPSEITFDNNVKKIAILNNAVYPDADSLSGNFADKPSEKELFIIDTIVIIHFMDGLFSLLDESPNQVLNKSEYYEFRNNESYSVPGPLSELSVRDFCRETDSDILISLEYYNFFIKNYYSYSYLPEIHGYLEFNRKSLWRIYEKNGRILDEQMFNDTVYWSSAGYSRNEADAGLPGATDAMRSAFYFAGIEYGKHISPYWSEVSRVYYSFRDRKKIFSNTDYSFDKKRLQKLITGMRSDMAYKAAINLALLSEKEDNLNDSLDWLNTAEARRPGTKLVSEYMKIIRERLIMKDKLDRQLDDF